MKYLAAVLVLLAVVGVGRAGDKEIIERLNAMDGVSVQRVAKDGGLFVSLDANNLDAPLAELCELRGLRHVALRNSGLADNQLQQVCALPGVRTLHFIDCPITDTQLKIVARVRGLEALCLWETAVTDEGLAELTRLLNLHVFCLRGTAFTDAGLRHLEGMRGLTSLDLRACPNTTDVGVARLKKALPNCKIYR